MKKILALFVAVILTLSFTSMSFASTSRNESNYIIMWWSNSGGVLVPLTCTGYASIQEDYNVQYSGSYVNYILYRHNVYGSIKTNILGNSAVVVVSPTINYSNGYGSASISYAPCLTSDKYYDNKQGTASKVVRSGSTVASGQVTWSFYSSAGFLQQPITNKTISVSL